MLGRSVVHWFLETETFDDSFPSVVRHSPRERSAIIRLHEDPKRFAKRVTVELFIILQARDVDVWFATFWSGNWQILWGIACIPTMWLPLPGQDTPSPRSFFQDLADTISCMAGNLPQAGDENCQTSPTGWFWAGFYFFFNLAFNICLLFLTKSQSANWAQIATVLCLNLCSFLSQFKFLMGDAAEPMNYFDYMALALASLALWCYNLQKEDVRRLGAEDGEAGVAGVEDGAPGGNADVDDRSPSRDRSIGAAGLRSFLMSGSVVADGPAGRLLMSSVLECEQDKQDVDVKVNGGGETRRR